jgi:branched-chain amino acid transport system permease protein
MTTFLAYALPGLPYGCVFALLAVGLVLTYQTSGVFNLAFGAQAYLAALVFYVTDESGWPKWLAFVLAVLLVSPLVGLAMDRFLYRHVRSAPPLVKLVSALGMLIAIPSILQVVFGSAPRLGPPSLLLSPTTVYFRVLGDPVNGTEVSTVLVTAAVVLVLALMMHFTQTGLRMRAVAESPRMVELAGIDADRVGALTWALSSVLAGLAGVLLAPLFASLTSLDFTQLLVDAIAAAVVGGLTSLPLAFVGGVGLGVLQEILGGYLPSGSVLSSGLRPALPFVVLLVVLVAFPGVARGRALADPLASCDPPPAPLAAAVRTRQLATAMRVGFQVLLVVFVLSCLTWVPLNWVSTFASGVALSVIFLSIVLLTGMSGQISLCQAAFAGAGAFAAGQLAAHFGLSVLVGILAGGAVAAVLGAVVALPALRLGGVALALATLAFGLLADSLGFQYSWSGNGATGVVVPRPQLGPIDFADDRTFLVLALVVLTLGIAVVNLVQRGTTGRYLKAMRGSELAAASIGIDLTRAKVTVFALSAGLAGVGGALYGSLQTAVSPTDFNSTFSLVWMVVVATTGVYTAEGAIQAGFAYAVISQGLSYVPQRFANILPILFGLGAITYALHPEGIVEYEKRVWTERAMAPWSRLRGGSPGGGQVSEALPSPSLGGQGAP